MKKIFVLLGALMLFGCQSSTENSNDENIGEDTVVVDEATTELNTFMDSELGIKFSYPMSFRLNVESNLEQIDVGDMKRIQILNGNDSVGFISMTSADYELGAADGCCWHYSSPSIDLENIDYENLDSEFGKALGNDLFDFSITTVGGEDALQFIRESSYIDHVLFQTWLMPYDVEPYTNLMIQSASIYSGDDVSDLDEVTLTYDENYEALLEIIKSVEFM